MFENLLKKFSALLIGSNNTAGINTVDDSGTPPGEDLQLREINRKFSSEMFAQLLLELPGHRQSMQAAYTSGNDRQLSECVHKLLGGTAYCDAPELEASLRELRMALRTGNRDSIDIYFGRAINTMDITLAASGYRAS
jgi:HPt (histidine-containing phosphotransfer) domain-containing protein